MHLYAYMCIFRAEWLSLYFFFNCDEVVFRRCIHTDKYCVQTLFWAQVTPEGIFPQQYQIGLFYDHLLSLYYMWESQTKLFSNFSLELLLEPLTRNTGLWQSHLLFVEVDAFLHGRQQDCAGEGHHGRCNQTRSRSRHKSQDLFTSKSSCISYYHILLFIQYNINLIKVSCCHAMIGPILGNRSLGSNP